MKKKLDINLLKNNNLTYTKKDVSYGSFYGYDDGGHGATLQYCMSTGRIAAEAAKNYIGK